MKIRISWKGGSATATLQNTPTAKKVTEALPIKGMAQRWGKEVYFRAPVSTAREPDADDVVDPGSLCYWVEGGCIAMPWGRTPASRGNECRLAAKVNIFGKMDGDPSVLESAKEGGEIVLEEA